MFNIKYIIMRKVVTFILGLIVLFPFISCSDSSDMDEVENVVAKRGLKTNGLAIINGIEVDTTRIYSSPEEYLEELYAMQKWERLQFPIQTMANVELKEHTLYGYNSILGYPNKTCAINKENALKYGVAPNLYIAHYQEVKNSVSVGENTIVAQMDSPNCGYIVGAMSSNTRGYNMVKKGNVYEFTTFIFFIVSDIGGIAYNKSCPCPAGSLQWVYGTIDL